jgi:hypothetical protein
VPPHHPKPPPRAPRAWPLPGLGLASPAHAVVASPPRDVGVSPPRGRVVSPRRGVVVSPPRRSPRASLSPPGQAAVELVALLPLVALVLALGYQVVVAGHTAWQARVAARAAARANAVGADVSRAARDHLPPALERGLRIHAESQGDVRVSLRIPQVLPAVSLGRVAVTAHFRSQRG